MYTEAPLFIVAAGGRGGGGGRREASSLGRAKSLRGAQIAAVHCEKVGVTPRRVAVFRLTKNLNKKSRIPVGTWLIDIVIVSQWKN